jgi:hypothetical protein
MTATSGTIGGWTLGATTISATSITLDSGNQRISVGATSPILIDGANKKIESSNYVSGYAGSGFHIDENLMEVGNIACRGLIRTSVFQKDVISTVGGNLMVLDGDVLATDMTAADNSTMTTKATTTFAVGDILRIKDGTDDEWFTVTNIASAPTYTVTRDCASDYASNSNPAWSKGATIVNYGQSGDGGLYMTASESNAPYLSVFTHAGSPWSDITTRLRIGNLNGYLGYTTDLYGIGIGDSTHYLKYDPTNHLRIRGDIDASIITGGTIRTAASGVRIEMTGSGTDYNFNVYDVDEGSTLTIATNSAAVGYIQAIEVSTNVRALFLNTGIADATYQTLEITNFGLSECLTLENKNASNTDPLLQFTNVGSGADIRGTSGTWNITKAGAITCVGLEAGTGAMNCTGADIGSQKITNVLDPTGDQDAATKKYVDDNHPGFYVHNGPTGNLSGLLDSNQYITLEIDVGFVPRYFEAEIYTDVSKDVLWRYANNANVARQVIHAKCLMGGNFIGPFMEKNDDTVPPNSKASLDMYEHSTENDGLPIYRASGTSASPGTNQVKPTGMGGYAILYDITISGTSLVFKWYAAAATTDFELRYGVAGIVAYE